MTNFFASNKLPWSFSPTLCLPMSDASYDPHGTNTQDLLEETVHGSFGRVTLYCKYDCCGDSKNAECCLQEQTVDPDGLETYKLVSIVAAGIAGLCLLTVSILYLVKRYMKKRRLIRDINSINRMNNIKDITKIKVSKYQKNKERPMKDQPLFKKSKKTPSSFQPSTPIAIPSTQKPPLPQVQVARPPYNPQPFMKTLPVNNNNVAPSFLDKAPPPPPVIAPPAIVPPPATYEDALFSHHSSNMATMTGPRLPSLIGTGTVLQYD